MAPHMYGVESTDTLAEAVAKLQAADPTLPRDVAEIIAQDIFSRL